LATALAGGSAAWPLYPEPADYKTAVESAFACLTLTALASPPSAVSAVPIRAGVSLTNPLTGDGGFRVAYGS